MPTADLIEAPLTGSVIGAFYEVHRILGFGFLEQVYAAALTRDLAALGHRVSREVAVPVMYKGDALAIQRLDMVVDEKVVIEIKATEVMHARAERQLLNYLRASNLEVGLLLQFGLKAEFRRIISTHSRRGA
jgi:GxxExxY protein